MKEYPKVAVVILNWNGRFFLEKFLPSVFNSTYPNLDFIVGDNGSTDDSVDFIRTTYPTIQVIQNQKNLGFAGGYNEILKQVNADYFVLLNSDVEVTDNWIEPIITLMNDRDDLVAVQPKIRSYHHKEKFEHAGASGGFIDTFGYPFCRGRILDKTEKDLGQYDEVKEVFWATGAALFIKASAWQEVGGFDSDFFAHMEEIDLCWRLKKLGYSVAVCPESVIYHVGGGTLNTSNPQKTYLNFRNNLIMLQKNLPLFSAFLVIFIRLWLDLLAVFKFLFEGKPKDAWAVSRAHQYFFWNIFRNAKKRQKLKMIENKTGMYSKSVMWNYFVGGISKFSDLKQEDFK